MQKNFPLAWIAPHTITIDESLWAFKGRTYLKRFMKDKPKKYGLLEYALCTLSGYFLHVLVHHVPGKEKRKKRGLNEQNMDRDSIIQLKLQKRYGEQGAIVMRLVSCLRNQVHHIIGDNAFSSVQLVHDMQKGKFNLLSFYLYYYRYMSTFIHQSTELYWNAGNGKRRKIYALYGVQESTVWRMGQDKKV